MCRIKGDEKMNVQKNPQFHQFSRMKIHQENLKNNTVMSYVIGVVITLVIACVGFYFFLPPKREILFV